MCTFDAGELFTLNRYLKYENPVQYDQYEWVLDGKRLCETLSKNVGKNAAVVVLFALFIYDLI